MVKESHKVIQIHSFKIQHLLCTYDVPLGTQSIGGETKKPEIIIEYVESDDRNMPEEMVDFTNGLWTTGGP